MESIEMSGFFWSHDITNSASAQVFSTAADNQTQVKKREG